MLQVGKQMHLGRSEQPFVRHLESSNPILAQPSHLVLLVDHFLPPPSLSPSHASRPLSSTSHRTSSSSTSSSIYHSLAASSATTTIPGSKTRFIPAHTKTLDLSCKKETSAHPQNQGIAVCHSWRRLDIRLKSFRPLWFVSFID